MDKFPEPRTMPTEWQEHDLVSAKRRAFVQAKLDEAEKEKAAKKVLNFEKDAKKERHLIEKFPSPKIEPEDWHCTHCDDDKK